MNILYESRLEASLQYFPIQHPYIHISPYIQGRAFFGLCHFVFGQPDNHHSQTSLTSSSLPSASLLSHKRASVSEGYDARVWVIDFSFVVIGNADRDK